MASPTEVARIALLALLAGALLPLLVQLFVTLRSLRRTTEALERRLDRTLVEIGELAADVRQRAAGPSSLGAALAAVAPTIVAAVQTFRSSTHASHDDDPVVANSHGIETKARKEHAT